MVWPFKKKQRAVSTSDPDIAKMFGLISDAVAGLEVNPDTVLQHATVFSCITKLTGAVGQMPVIAYKNNGARKTIAKEGWTKVLTKKPNDFQTTQQWIEQIILHLCLFGNHYSIVERNSRGKVIEFRPVKPNQVSINIRNGKLVYLINELESEAGQKTEAKEYSSYDILHIKNMTFNGYYGLAPVQLCKKSLALSMAAENHGVNFFKNSANPSGFLSTEQVLGKDAKKRLAKSWNAAHQGTDNAGKIAVFEQGLRFEQIGIDNKNAQFLESRSYQRSEICGIFGVPAAMIGSLDKATFNNTENLILSFHRDTLAPLMKRIEDGINAFLPDDFEIRLDDSAILRGDSKTQAEINEKYMMMGAITVNQVLESIGLPPVEGGDVRAESTSTVRLGGSDSAKEEDRGSISG